MKHHGEHKIKRKGWFSPTNENDFKQKMKLKWWMEDGKTQEKFMSRTAEVTLTSKSPMVNRVAASESVGGKSGLITFLFARFR